MPFEVNLLPDVSAIEVRLWDKLSIGELRSLSTQVISLGKDTGYRRALADCRDYLGGPGLGEVYFLTEEVTRRPASQRGAEALIAPRDPLVAADIEFYVAAARNRGSNVQIFAERHAATQWLLRDGQVQG
jgi:hypothetical protein